MSAISLENVGVTLGSTRILHNIDLEVSPGTTLAIVGPNGSGKSTLVRACLGVLPHSGTIKLLGNKLGRRVDWSRVGYTPQRVTAAAGVPATALEVVGSGLVYGRRLSLPRGWKKVAQQHLDAVGLGHRAHESVQTFSGGQQQRVLLARSLVRNPDLLFLDEPFSGVDRDSRAAITKTLAERRHAGMTIVLVLHELFDLAPLIDQTIVIEHGNIVSRGPAPIPPDGHNHPGHDHDHPHADEYTSFRTPTF